MKYHSFRILRAMPVIRAAPLLLACAWPMATADEPLAGGFIEYFINIDPGPGNGTRVNATNGSMNFTAALGGLPPGSHSLYLRVRSDDGVWGPALPYTFAIELSSSFETVAGWEASIGTPAAPGEGQALPTPGELAMKTVLSGTVNLLDQQGIGTTHLYLRARDNAGTWGPALPYTFVIEPSGAGEIPAAIQYAWNPDFTQPVWVNLPLTDPSASLRSITFDPGAASMPLGTQTLGVRTVDSSGDAGVPVIMPVAIVPASLTGHPTGAEKLVIFAENAAGVIPGSLVEMAFSGHAAADSSHSFTLPIDGAAPGPAKVIAYIQSDTGETGPHAMATFTVVVEGTNGYETWKASGSYFTVAERADPAVSGMKADPDNDGITNDLEFAFGSHPRQRDLVKLPQSTQENGRLVFHFRQKQGGAGHRAYNYTADGVRYSVQFSYGLDGDWSEGGNEAFEILNVTSNGDGTDTVSVSPTTKVTEGRHQVFLRLAIKLL